MCWFHGKALCWFSAPSRSCICSIDFCPPNTECAFRHHPLRKLKHIWSSALHLAHLIGLITKVGLQALQITFQRGVSDLWAIPLKPAENSISGITITLSNFKWKMKLDLKQYRKTSFQVSSRYILLKKFGNKNFEEIRSWRLNSCQKIIKTLKVREKEAQFKSSL